MAEFNPKLTATEPKSVFTKPLTVDFKALFTALSKGIGHTVTGKWQELGTDTVEAMSSIGLATEPEELAFILIRRAITKALFDLVAEGASHALADTKLDEASLIERLDFSISIRGVHIDRKFLERPSELPLIHDVEVLLQQWLEVHGLAKATAIAISLRFPSYFVFALNQEWRRNAKSYTPILVALDTPFTKAGEREWAWVTYFALLQRRVQEGIFDEPFSLSQVFIPLNAYYLEDPTRKGSIDETSHKGGRRVVVSLQEELQKWLEGANCEDTIRVISGGPGSGKSSFARIFAARLASEGKQRVLFVPLHLIDPSKDLVDEVGRFVKDEGILLQNPLDPESPELRLLIIFDGLDELASQGKAASETARAFVREVERTVEKRNLQTLKLRVLISGREVVIQENESEFRRAKQILSLLPYFVPRQAKGERDKLNEGDGDEYSDPQELLVHDLRQQWWKNFGVLTGKPYEGLPKELNRPDLEEITGQPLLNYLVALSFSRDKLDFKKDINLNWIYGDLVAAVHERGYEKRRAYAPIRHMTPDEFKRVLEEIGLAAWHGDGRTTSVREIEEHCRASGVGALLDKFQEGAKAGVTRLLAAFFFRQYGQRATGDATFVFTHKSFGEYLAALRIVRAVERMVRELERRLKNPDEGWDERDALKHWAQVCGPSAMSRYIHVFLLNEIRLRPTNQLPLYQMRLAKLFGYMLRHGMPMEQLQIVPFREAVFQSRNAEESMLVALNACAMVTQAVSPIEHPSPTAFAAWFKRIQGQRTSAESSLAASCLAFLDLSHSVLHISDFYGANLRGAKLQRVVAAYGTFHAANLINVDLREAFLRQANFAGTTLVGSDLRGSHWEGANLEGADMEGTNLEHADLEGANLKGANLRGVALKGVNLQKVDLRGANLEGAKLQGVKLEGAELEGARLEGANLDGKDLTPELVPPLSPSES